ncbi:hypothetical protein PLICRDRAFT_699260 [Plicaturopsis crispa FD-325 SS-3]|nr:hypothetical protein PLICRDRAFT_699260 [Plicaturopsis crispa FD-325 SS-3]
MQPSTSRTAPAARTPMQRAEDLPSSHAGDLPARQRAEPQHPRADPQHLHALEARIARVKALLSDLSTAQTREEKQRVKRALREENRFIEDRHTGKRPRDSHQPQPQSHWPETDPAAVVLIISDDEDEEEGEGGYDPRDRGPLKAHWIVSTS